MIDICQEPRGIVTLYQDRAGGYSWRVRDKGNNIVGVSSSPAPQRRFAKEDIREAAKAAGEATIFLILFPTFQVFKSDKGRYFWRLVSQDSTLAKGKISFASFEMAKKDIEKFKKTIISSQERFDRGVIIQEEREDA